MEKFFLVAKALAVIAFGVIAGGLTRYGIAELHYGLSSGWRFLLVALVIATLVCMYLLKGLYLELGSFRLRMRK